MDRPTKHPTAAEHQRVIEVVKPLIEHPSFTITPIQIKETPEIICAIILVLSPYIMGVIRVKRVLPNVKSDTVLIPTDLPHFSRSNPIKKPSNIENNNFRIIVQYI